MDDAQRAAAFYDADPEGEWDRQEGFSLTWELSSRLLARHLPAGCGVADIGCGAGRTSLELARRGHTVVASDLSARCLRAARARPLADRVHWVQGDARRLDHLEDASVDAAVMMGPLYHLTSPEDRDLALAEALRVVRPGGVVVLGFLCRAAAFRAMLLIEPAQILRSVGSRVLRDGVAGDGLELGFTRAWYADPQDVAALASRHGIGGGVLYGCEPIVGPLADTLRDATPAVRERWVSLLLEHAAHPAWLGASSHLLYIASKEEADVVANGP